MILVLLPHRSRNSAALPCPRVRVGRDRLLCLVRKDGLDSNQPPMILTESRGESPGIHSGDEADCMFSMHMV